MSFKIPNWPSNPPKYTKEEIELILKDSKPLVKTENVTLSFLIENSEKFPIKFPIETVRCKTLQNTVKREILEKNINSAYPIIHERVLKFCATFLLEKRKNGTEIEKTLYKNMTVTELIQRLLDKRSVLFVGQLDRYILLDNTFGANDWDTIGTDEETHPLVLANYLSYDEIKLSAFLSVSSHTYFINSGKRNNLGKVEENRNLLEEDGVIVGLVGPRLRKKYFMDYQEIILENKTKKKISLLTTKLYEEKVNTSYDKSRHTVIKKDVYFDNVIYSKRLAITFDTFLYEANQRALDCGKFAYVHVVGIGLGVWKMSPHQGEIFLDTFAKRLV